MCVLVLTCLADWTESRKAELKIVTVGRLPTDTAGFEGSSMKVYRIWIPE